MDLLNRVYPLHKMAQLLPSKEFMYRFRHIMVSGPERSGTTFTAKYLADLLGYAHVDEMKRHTFNDSIVCTPFCFDPLFKTRDHVVSQRAGESHRLHKIRDNTTLIIFMARNCLDVFSSQNRIFTPTRSWTCAYGRTKELGKYLNSKELENFYDRTEMICKIKQDVWKRYQMQVLKSTGISYITVDYESLKYNTTSFKHKKERIHFHSKQIER